MVTFFAFSFFDRRTIFANTLRKVKTPAGIGLIDQFLARGTSWNIDWLTDNFLAGIILFTALSVPGNELITRTARGNWHVDHRSLLAFVKGAIAIVQGFVLREAFAAVRIRIVRTLFRLAMERDATAEIPFRYLVFTLVTRDRRRRGARVLHARGRIKTSACISRSVRGMLAGGIASRRRVSGTDIWNAYGFPTTARRKYVFNVLAIGAIWFWVRRAKNIFASEFRAIAYIFALFGYLTIAALRSGHCGTYLWLARGLRQTPALVARRLDQSVTTVARNIRERETVPSLAF